MATAEDYANWIVKNEAKKGTPEFETVAQAYRQAREAGSPEWKGSTNQTGNSGNNFVEAIKNVPGSAMQVGQNLAHAVTHPLDTGMSLMDAAAGGLRNITPAPLRSAIDTLDSDPANQQRISATADAVGQSYKQRYGGLDAIKNTLIKDPVGAAMDLSTVFGAGGATLPGKVSQALNTASKYTNPLSAVSPIVKGSGEVVKGILGTTTGAGGEAISQAFKSGKDVKPDFLQNLNGNVPISDVLDTAKQGLENMRIQKSAEYRSGMSGVSKDKTVLNFKGINTALQDAADMVTYKGQVKNQKAAEVIGEMNNEVTKWRLLRPDEFHTPEGLDALKQKLGGILESIPYEEKTARLAAGKVYTAVKSEIQQQAPTYAKTMQDYSQASEQISEIERALSLGDRAAKDTAIRKLQSLTRNNVQTNYGNRLALAEDLQNQGGIDIMPALAGQAMNSFTPRGLVGQAGGYATAATALANPYALLALPLQSPRTVGLGTYGAGRAAGVFGRAGNKLGINADRARLAGLLGYELRDQQP